MIEAKRSLEQAVVDELVPLGFKVGARYDTRNGKPIADIVYLLLVKE